MIPQIDNIDLTNEEEIKMPSRTYKLNLEVDTVTKEYNGYAEAEGTNIALSNSTYEPVHNIDIQGNIIQNSTTGKNLFNMDGNPIDDLLSSAGYTLKYNDDKTITINGTGTGAYKYLTWNLTLEAGTYIANGCPSGGSQNGYSFLINVGSSTYWDYGNGVSFTLTARTTIQLHPIRTGSNIPTFNNVTFKPMIRLSSITDASYEPYTGGASPNPQYKQPINSAGDNINLFDKTANIIRGYTYTSSGGTTQLDNCFVQEKYIEVESSKEYILSTTNSYISETDYRLVICEYDSSKNFIKRNLSSTQYYKITTSATTKYVRLCASTVTIDELKFEHGSIATPYTPYGMGSINEVISNKNLCNGINQNYFINANATSTGVASGNSGLLIKTDRISSYTISTKVSQARYRVGVSKTIPTSVSGITLYNGQAKDGTNNSITINSNGYDYLIVNATDLTNIQIEKSSSSTSFVAHQEQNISIPCQQPMRSIGNVRDSFVKIDGVWYEKHNIGQVILNGSESGWVERGNTSENYIKFRNANALPYDIKGDLLLISDYFVTNIGANNASYSGNAICGNSGNYAKWLHISIDNTIVNSVETFKTWLSTHNTEVIYQLAEPIYLECTEEQITALEKMLQCKTYPSVTNINSLDITPSRLIVQYYAKNNVIYKPTKIDTIAGFIDNTDAIKQSIYHILSIERYAYDIYDDDYGVELEQYIGKDFEYLEATIQETLEEALTQDERILGVEVTNIEQLNDDSALVAFNAITQNNELEMEVTINV